jgi:hypothetical protein
MESISQSCMRDWSWRDSSPWACRPARILLRCAEVAEEGAEEEEGRRSSRPAPSLRRRPWRAVLAEVKDWGKGASELRRVLGRERLEADEEEEAAAAAAAARLRLLLRVSIQGKGARGEEGGGRPAGRD